MNLAFADESIQTGLYYYAKGANIFGSDNWGYYSSHYLINAMQLPVYVNLHSKRGPYGQFFAGIGAYADYHISAKEFAADDEREIKIGSEQKDQLKNWDFGFGLQAGYKVNNGFMVRMQYQYGLVNICPIPEVKIFSRSLSVTAALLIPTSEKKKGCDPLIH